MIDRVPCCIMGCRRTFKRDAVDIGLPVESLEYMCGKHYRMASPKLRALRTMIKRRGKRHGWSFKMERVDNLLWARAKRQATERMMGL